MTHTPSDIQPSDIWADFCAATGHTGPRPPVDRFGDDPQMADTLLDLVLSGTKRGTCELVAVFEAEGHPLPRPGDYWIMTDGRGVERAIIRTTHIDIRPVAAVDAAFAAIEGEGDGSLAFWKRAHDAYYTRMGVRYGFAYSDDMDCVCEVFSCVWPPDASHHARMP